MLVSSALVLLMAIPALGLFYGGLVRSKNMLSVLMQTFMIVSLVAILWVTFGYSLAFTSGSPYLGGLSKAFLSGVGVSTYAATFSNNVYIPEYAFVIFQMTFACITPALIVGAFAERIKFWPLMLFCGLWVTIVYFPLAHMVWYWSGPDFLADNPTDMGLIWGWGGLDFAGGTVVHINAGVAGLVAAIVLGKRLGYGSENLSPYNLGFAVIGAALLWVGWFGFNAGSALGSSGGRAGMAMLVTQIAAAGAVLSWLAAEWIGKGKPSVLGAISGAVAGLVAITPAAGFVLPGSALIIGLVAGVAGYWGATALKRALKYDDSLDAFGVHGICGIVGALLVGFLAYGPLSATTAVPDGLSGGMEQFIKQVIAVAATMAYTAVATWILLKITDVIVGLRVTEEEEREGLDVALHGEHIN
jgi:Amt family ammonium transporter